MWEPFALVFPPEDIAKFEEIVVRGAIEIAPRLFAFGFGLELPFSREAFRADFDLFPSLVKSFPDVDVSHAAVLADLFTSVWRKKFLVPTFFFFFSVRITPLYRVPHSSENDSTRNSVCEQSAHNGEGEANK
jgi:hypothetical protein